jgi:hypothetical protein
MPTGLSDNTTPDDLVGTQEDVPRSEDRLLDGDDGNQAVIVGQTVCVRWFDRFHWQSQGFSEASSVDLP